MPLDYSVKETAPTSEQPKNPLEGLYRELFEEALREIEHLGETALKNARAFFEQVLPNVLSGTADWQVIYNKIDCPDLVDPEAAN